MSIPLASGQTGFEVIQQRMLKLHDPDPQVAERVKTILSQIRESGDKAVSSICSSLNDPSPQKLDLNDFDFSALAPEIKIALEQAAENITAYASQIAKQAQSFSLEQAEFTVGLQWRPVERVLCYVPGGRYPLPSTALMTTLTAKAAGVPEIFLTSPNITRETAYAAKLAGLKSVYQLGGAQAIAAFAYGTQTIPKVDLIVGPGNAYVTEAKRQLQGSVGIDMLAGPSEVVIIADQTASPEQIAWDLLAQAEHDPDARSILLTDSQDLAQHVQLHVKQILAKKLLAHFLPESIQNSHLIVLPSLPDCVVATNQLAPEHVQVMTEHAAELSKDLTHYGALFIGHHATVAHGDYFAGPNHTLPTASRARFQGALNPMQFLRAQSWIQVQPDAQKIHDQTAHLAACEGLMAHAGAAQSRLSAPV